MNGKTWLRLMLWLAVLATAWMIFWFSAQNGMASSQLSGGITEKVVEVVEPDYASLTEPEQQTLFDAVQFAVRKSAHFSEYALLGFLLRLLCASYALRRGGLVAWLCGTGYAATDELHQWVRRGAIRHVAGRLPGQFRRPCRRAVCHGHTRPDCL